MDISLRIKELRNSKKLSQSDFAKSIGIDNSQLSKIERGILQPTINQIMEISSIYNTTTDWLLFGKEQHANHLNEPNTKYENIDPGYEAFLKYLQKENTITILEKLLTERKK